MTEVASAAAAAAIRPAEDRQGSGAAPTVSEPTNGLSADFETFLRLLTTQMQNQDPLQPIESTEFVAQLAQFSSVEQQVATNKNLETILEKMAGGDPARLADWLGRNVRSEAPLPVSGEPGPVEVSPQPAEEISATAASLVVRDAAGDTVAEVPFEPGADTVIWNGRTAAGDPAPAGAYSFATRYADANGASEVIPAATYNEVVEARRGEDGIDLVLSGGAVIAADQVTAVR